MTAAHVELSRRAERDLRHLSASDRRRLLKAIKPSFGPGPLPANADDRPLSGRAPWRRVGELRVLYREMTSDELPAGVTSGRLIARIIHRGDLHTVVGTLTRPVAALS